MNTEKNISTRIIHKHDTEANWNKATNFIPKQGELIVYDKDQNHSQIRLKMGDGTTKVNDLPFSIDEILIGTTEEITPTQVKEAIEAGQNLLISHTDSAWGGEMKFSSFVYSSPFNTVLASGIFMYASEYYVAEIYGSLTYNTWNSTSTKLAQYDDIPKALYVTILDNGDGTGTSDKTYEEILAAYENGSAILGRIDAEETSCVILNLMSKEDEFAFGVTGVDANGLYWAATVTKDEGTLVANLPLVQSPVIGTTAEITPSQVKALMDEGKSFAITHTDSTYGSMLFNSFVYSQAVGSYILSTTVFQVANVTFCAQLFGNFSSNTWEFSAFELAKSEDIPTALKNPHVLTINGTSYDGSEAKTISGLATETYVNNKVAAMVDSAPETLNTLNELAAALGDDPNFATTIANQIGNKVDRVSGKGLSANDYTTTEKNKLAGIAEGANKTIIDTAFSSTSTNPVQNKVVKEALDKKPGEIVAGKTYTIDDEAVTAATGAEIFNSSSNIASGAYSHAEGSVTKAIGKYSHAEGNWTTASGDCAHAEGFGSIASNDCAHAEGYDTEATGNYSHAEGECTQAIGDRSHAEGYHTIAAGYQQHVQGRYNIEDSENKYAHIIGNGYANPTTVRSNAHTVDWAGNAWFAGDVYIKSSSGYYQDEGSKKLATEDQVNDKVDKVSGKGLSTNDYTDTEKAKLDNTNIAYGTCSTAAATAEKVVVLNGNTQWSLKTGSIIMVKFDVSNSAENVKINVNNTGAYPIWYNNAEYTSTGTAYTGYANRTITYIFNGTHYVWITSSYDANSTYTNAALGQGYATCSTAAATTAKVGTLSSYKLVTGGIVSVAFTNAVPANATLNINSTGAKSIYFRGAKITGDVIKAGDVATFVYSTYYRLISIDRWQNDISTMQTQINNKLDTDDVNSLIDAKLAEIINAEEVAF